MPVDITQALSVTYGGALFNARAYAWKEEAVVKAGFGRTDTRYTVTIEGWVEDVTADGFAAKLADLVRALGQDGYYLVIKGINGVVERQIPAAICKDKGPSVSHEMLGADGPLHRNVRVTVAAVAAYADDTTTTPVLDTYKFKFSRRPDGLVTATRAGQLNGAQTQAYLLTQVLQQFEQAYGRGQWVISTADYEVDGDARQSHTLYNLVAVQLAAPLPAGGGGGGAVVEGEYTMAADRDEQLLVKTTHTYDLLLEPGGDPRSLHESLRPAGGGGAATLVQESYSATHHKEVRVRSVFVVLRGDGNTDLRSFSQRVEIAGADDAYEVRHYPGADPVLIRRPADVRRVTQSGEAVGITDWPNPPDPLSRTFADKPLVTFDLVNQFECRTSWKYVMLADPDDNGDGPLDQVKPDDLDQRTSLGRLNGGTV